MMKRFLAAVTVSLVMVCLLFAQSTVTPNLQLQIPSYQQTNWQVPLNYDMNLLDTILGATQLLPTGSTPLISQQANWITQNTLAVTITNFVGGLSGQTLHIFCGASDTVTTIATSSNIVVTSSWTCASSSKSITLVMISGIWTELARSGGSGGGGGGAFIGGLGGSFQDVTGIITPGNPASGNYRLYMNSGTGFLSCLTTLGANCMPGAANVPGGSNLQFQFNNGGTFLGNGCAFLSTTGGPFNLGCDFHAIGMSPYRDVTLYGVRTVSSLSAAPYGPGMTGTISASSTSLAVSSAWPGVMGDGAMVIGAGAPCTLSTPTGVTVTPSVAIGPTGVLLDAPGMTGSTTYTYQVIARDAAGCYTPASISGVTSTGAGSLGANSMSISGFTQSGNVVTATVGSTANLVNGAWVRISTPSNLDAGTFGGWYHITVASPTTFTYATGNTVGGGAPATSQGGATMYWWNSNVVSWTPITGAYQYYIYGRIGGSLALIGKSFINLPSQGFPVSSWEDYGATMNGTQNFPYWIPTTPPSSGIADPLVTTILSGSTNLTLATAATTSVTGAMVLFDNCPNFLTAAATLSTGGGLLYFPPGQNYLFNSHCKVPNFAPMELAAAGIIVNDTLEFDSALRMLGMIGPQGPDATSFGWQTGGTITSINAYPAVWDATGSDEFVEGILISSQGSNGLELLVGAGGNGHFKNMNFNGGTNDYLGMGIMMIGGFWYDFDHISINTGPGQEGGGFEGSTSAPGAYFSTGGISFSYLSLQDRGIMVAVSGAGAEVQFTGQSRSQGAITPFVTLGQTGGNCVGGTILMHNTDPDTTPQALLANSASCYVGRVIMDVVGNDFPASGYSPITGTPIQQVIGPGQNTMAINAAAFTNNAVSVTDTGQFMFPISNVTPLAAAVSSGGLVPIGNISYEMVVVDVNGNQSVPGPFVNVTTTSGNQTVTLTAPPLAGAISWLPFRCGANGMGCSQLACFPQPFGVNYVDTVAAGCGQSPPAVNRAGASTLGQAGISAPQINVVVPGFKNTVKGPATATANRTTLLADMNGQVTEIVGYDSQAGKTTAQTAKSLLNPATGLTFTVGANNTLFEVVASVACDSSSSGATVLATILYTDVSGTAQTITTSTATCTTLGASSVAALSSAPFMAQAGSAIQYSTTIANTPTYDVRVAVKQLGVN